LPAALKSDAEMYAGCVAGAIQKEDYLAQIEKAGFTNIAVQKVKPIIIPDDILSKYLSPDEVAAFNKENTGIFSISVYAKKPGVKPLKEIAPLADAQGESCEPGGSCC